MILPPCGPCVGQSIYSRLARYEDVNDCRGPFAGEERYVSRSGDNANLHHEVWQRQTLDLNYRGGGEYRLSENLILEPAAAFIAESMSMTKSISSTMLSIVAPKWARTLLTLA
jgi:hypothetical protein